MHIIVELDGILFDVKQAVWAAYSVAVERTGLARTDETTLWRLVRTGADEAQWIRGAQPRHVEVLRSAFAEAMDSDEVLARLVPHDDVAETMQVLRDLGPHRAVTTGSNIARRHELIRQNGMADAFPTLAQVPSPASAGAGALNQLAGDQRVIVVLGATVPLIRAADHAGMTAIGISSGPATGKRLAGAGARATYRDVPEFAQALRDGDEPLRRANLVF